MNSDNNTLKKMLGVTTCLGSKTWVSNAVTSGIIISCRSLTSLIGVVRGKPKSFHPWEQPTAIAMTGDACCCVCQQHDMVVVEEDLDKNTCRDPSSSSRQKTCPACRHDAAATTEKYYYHYYYYYSLRKPRTHAIIYMDDWNYLTAEQEKEEEKANRMTRMRINHRNRNRNRNLKLEETKDNITVSTSDDALDEMIHNNYWLDWEYSRYGKE